MKPFPRKCANCREVAVEPAVLDVFSMPMAHDGRMYDVAVRELVAPRCARCGEVMLDDDAIERLYSALREAAGLLLPATIRDGRKSLGLTQVQMAELLRSGVATVARWESGGQIQTRSTDLLLRASFDVPEFREYLGCRSEVASAS